MSQINNLIKLAKINANNHGWYVSWNPKLMIPNIGDNVLSVGESLCLCHSELSEALEAFRDDDKAHFSEEMADEFIRLFHICGDLDINIEEAIIKKMEKNKLRPRNHGRVNY